PALVEAQAVACEELVGDGETHVAERDVLDETSIRTVEQRDRDEARGLSQRERVTEEAEGQPGVHDVLDEDYVATLERDVHVLQQANAAVATFGVRGELDD